MLDAQPDAAADGAAGPDAPAEDDAHAQESADSQRERLLVADTREPRLYAYDIGDRQLLATLPVGNAQRLSSGSTGRFGYVERNADRVLIVDMGLTEARTSRGLQYLPGPVQVLTQSPACSQPGSLHAHAGKAALFCAGNGNAQLFDESSLLGTFAPLLIAAGAPHAGLALPWNGKVLISTLPPGAAEPQLARFSSQGQIEDALDCLAPTAAAENGAVLAVGCQAGVLRLLAGQDSAELIAYPAGSAPVTRLVAHPSEPVFLAQAGGQLCLLRAGLTCLEAPPGMLDFSFDAAGKRVLALTRAGLLHSLDAHDLSDQGSFAVTSPLVGASTDLPTLAVGKQWLYVSDPAAAQVHVLHVASKTVVQELAVAGSPGLLAVFRYP